MKVAGLNRHCQLIESSNNKSAFGFPIIYPPIESHIDPSNLLSFSTYSQHTVWITKDRKAYAIGDNVDGQISNSIPKEMLDKETEVIIKDSDGKQCSFLSVVCGTYYTLYIASGQTEKDPPRLIYCISGLDPLFVKLNGRIPKSIYGGKCVCAAIDTEGGIVMFTRSIFDSPIPSVETVFLPDNEKPIKLACCNKFVNVLAASGRVYRSSFPKTGILDFEQVREISNEKIIDISSSFHHCFVVTNEGKVYGIGNNSYCILGFPKKLQKVDVFTEVKSLKKYNIVAAYAGFSHSLFMTKDGKLISCGQNNDCEMLINRKANISHPVKTKISDKVSFIIAGEFLTVYFVDGAEPPNMPNKTLCDENDKEKKESTY